MDLKEKIQENLKQSFKAKNETVTRTLRMLLSAIQNKEIEKNKKETGLADEEVENIIRVEIKKHRDSITAFTKGGRADLSEKEKEELEILETYIPPEMPQEEVEKIVQKTIDELGDVSEKDFGKIMKAAMAKLKRQASGDKVSAAVKKLLNA